MLHQLVIIRAHPRHKRRQRGTQHRLVQQQVRPAREIRQRRKIGGVSRHHHLAAACRETQRETVDKRRMLHPHRGDGQARLVMYRAGIDGANLDQRAKILAALILDAQHDIRLHRRQESVPVAGQPLGPVDHHRGLQPRRPGGMDQRTQLEIVIRMKMRDEDQRQRFEPHALIDKAARHPEPAIDDNQPPVEAQQAGGRHGRSGADRRAALGA